MPALLLALALLVAPSTRPADLTLAEPLRGEFAFADAIGSLRATDGVHVQVMWTALELEGVDPETPVDLDLPAGMTIGRALDLMLNAAHGGFAELAVVADGPVLVVTTLDHADALSSTLEMYDLRPLVDLQDGDRAQLVADLMDLIVDVVDSDGWRSNGGTLASMAELDGVLAVHAPRRTQVEVRRLLDKLAAVEKDDAEPEGDPEAAG